MANCHKHINRPAVASCVDCGRFLCAECADKYGEPSCDQCTVDLVDAGRNELYKGIAVTAVGFFIGLLLGGSSGSAGAAIFLGIFFAGIPWGWMALNRITPRMFLFLSLPGWAVYLVIKLWLASIIGIFVMPFKIYHIAAGMKESKALKEYAHS